ncbi:16S rRNA (guanine(527)-N(7))-methyltransferase RsmG [Tsuneonella suprasediminis]|uniref:Ribosomal RNA small subunit methyltransferase G n=1 Tax=Tsuneonella suprasediminis TaxID=2306996 RepID=A0A419QXU5_9SPHN|nr:16S rRNA (guanine(527)-N(7))-methyltransferase RsmG [Tsuneonella suprasediminis]RJX65510.1 16S rRNA (guanine(527)-N(7))-methyltransferase RsmG [Tsuneonella suprasediminis]
MISSEYEARELVLNLCGSDSIARFELVADRLRQENTRQNLVSAASLDSVWQRHIADSVQLLRHVPRETAMDLWLDLGTGAGFPGLAIAIARPDWNVCLVESRKRRVEWLGAMIAELDLRQCRIEGKRLELVDPVPASVISARAFAPLPKLLDLSRRFSTDDTLWLLPKGRSAGHEVSELPRQLRRMFHVEPSLTDPESGIVIGRAKEAKPV